MTTLVAGVGNIFLGDDGFGVEVARRLTGEELPGDVRVEDFGIRGVHLAYELLDGYDAVILVDATPRGGEPGTVYVLEPEVGETGAEDALIDAHGMEPGAVLALLDVLGGQVERVLIVGCEPASVEEGIGLSASVTGAIPQALEVIKELIADMQREVENASPSTGARPAAGAGSRDRPVDRAGRAPVPEHPTDVR